MVARHYQVRHIRGLGYRVVFACRARGCENRVRSSYFRTRDEAELHAPSVRQARCYFHARARRAVRS